jgi:hypothetical protein
MNKKILPILLTAMLLSGCGKDIIKNNNANTDISKVTKSEQSQASQESSITDSPTEKESSNQESNSVPGTNILSDTELNEFTTLFNTPKYKSFLAEPFNNPEDIDLDAVFYYGVGIDVKNISDDEISDYLTASNKDQVYGDLYVFRANDFNSFFETHLGTDTPKSLPNSYWTYVTSRDSYYYYHWDSMFDGKDFKCISGEKSGDTYTLRFTIDAEKHYERFADRIIKFTKSGDDLIMESNSIQWDDNCDKSQTFDVELYPSESPIHFVTYQPDPEDGIKIILVKDGKYLTSIGTNIWRGYDYDIRLNKINAVSFFDFNADGVKDILVIGESDLGQNIILEESVPNGYCYERCYGLNEKLEEELADNITVSSVKAKLLGDNTECKFDNYKDAYAHIARLHYMSDDRYTYGLIDTDGDDIPELVIDKLGYKVSLFAFENGTIHCLMYQWAYGAGGNYGYMYSPGKGVFINHNNDYAGAIQYDSYMTSHNKSEITTDYYVESYFFKDTDGDGIPSEEELSATDEMKVFNAHYHNCTDQEMTEDEIKAKIAEYDTYQYEEIGGDMNYDDFINSLK